MEQAVVLLKVFTGYNANRDIKAKMLGRDVPDGKDASND
jgi:hypothetical protein